MAGEDKELELLGIISYLYYYEDLVQADIADRLFLSRSTVSRLLKKPRQNGVVNLTINLPWERELVLEDALKEAFDIKAARVLVVQEEDKPRSFLEQLSQMAAYYIACKMK